METSSINQTYQRFPLIVRMICVILVGTFLVQDIAWAHPDNFDYNKPAQNNKLAPKSLFKDESISPSNYYAALIAREIGRLIPYEKLQLAGVKAALKKIKDEKWFVNNIAYTETEGEVLISFAGGGMLRYYDPSRVYSDRYKNQIIKELTLNGGLYMQYIKTAELPAGPEVTENIIAEIKNTETGRRIAPLKLYAPLGGIAVIFASWLYVDNIILRTIISVAIFSLMMFEFVGGISGLGPPGWVPQANKIKKEADKSAKEEVKPVPETTDSNSDRQLGPEDEGKSSLGELARKAQERKRGMSLPGSGLAAILLSLVLADYLYAAPSVKEILKSAFPPHILWKIFGLVLLIVSGWLIQHFANKYKSFSDMSVDERAELLIKDYEGSDRRFKKDIIALRGFLISDISKIVESLKKIKNKSRENIKRSANIQSIIDILEKEKGIKQQENSIVKIRSMGMPARGMQAEDPGLPESASAAQLFARSGGHLAGEGLGVKPVRNKPAIDSKSDLLATAQLRLQEMKAEGIRDVMVYGSLGDELVSVDEVIAGLGEKFEPLSKETFRRRGSGSSTGMIPWLWNRTMPRLRRAGLSDRLIASLAGLEEIFFSGVFIGSIMLGAQHCFEIDPIIGFGIGFLISKYVFYYLHKKGVYRLKDSVLESGPPQPGDLVPLMSMQAITQSVYFILMHYLPFGTLNILVALPLPIILHSFYNSFLAPMADMPLGMAGSARELTETGVEVQFEIDPRNFAGTIPFEAMKQAMYDRGYDEKAWVAVKEFSHEISQNAAKAIGSLWLAEEYGSFERLMGLGLDEKALNNLVNSYLDQGRQKTVIKFIWRLDKNRLTLRIKNNCVPNEYLKVRIDKAFKKSYEGVTDEEIERIGSGDSIYNTRLSGVKGGIGIVARLAEEAGGKMYYDIGETEEGWTTFTLELPLTPPPAHTDKAVQKEILTQGIGPTGIIDLYMERLGSNTPKLNAALDLVKQSLAHDPEILSSLAAKPSNDPGETRESLDDYIFATAEKTGLLKWPDEDDITPVVLAMISEMFGSYATFKALYEIGGISADMKYIGMHCLQVARYIELMSRHMEIDDNTRNSAIRTALIHDLAKIEILKIIKLGRILTRDEIGMVNKHSARSGEIMKLFIEERNTLSFFEMQHIYNGGTDAVSHLLRWIDRNETEAFAMVDYISNHHAPRPDNTIEQLVFVSDVVEGMTDGTRRYHLHSGGSKKKKQIIEALRGISQFRKVPPYITDTMVGLIENGDKEFEFMRSQLYGFTAFYNAVTFAALSGSDMDTRNAIREAEDRFGSAKVRVILDAILESNLDIPERLIMARNVNDILDGLGNAIFNIDKLDILFIMPDAVFLDFINANLRLDMAEDDVKRLREGDGLALVVGEKRMLMDAYNFISKKMNIEKPNNIFGIDISDLKKGEVNLLALPEGVVVEKPDRSSVAQALLGVMSRLRGYAKKMKREEISRKVHVLMENKLFRGIAYMMSEGPDEEKELAQDIVTEILLNDEKDTPLGRRIIIELFKSGWIMLDIDWLSYDSLRKAVAENVPSAENNEYLLRIAAEIANAIEIAKKRLLAIAEIKNLTDDDIYLLDRYVRNSVLVSQIFLYSGDTENAYYFASHAFYFNRNPETDGAIFDNLQNIIEDIIDHSNQPALLVNAYLVKALWFIQSGDTGLARDFFDMARSSLQTLPDDKILDSVLSRLLNIDKPLGEWLEKSDGVSSFSRRKQNGLLKLALSCQAISSGYLTARDPSRAAYYFLKGKETISLIEDREMKDFLEGLVNDNRLDLESYPIPVFDFKDRNLKVKDVSIDWLEEQFDMRSSRRRVFYDIASGNWYMLDSPRTPDITKWAQAASILFVIGAVLDYIYPVMKKTAYKEAGLDLLVFIVGIAAALITLSIVKRISAASYKYSFNKISKMIYEKFGREIKKKRLNGYSSLIKKYAELEASYLMLRPLGEGIKLGSIIAAVWIFQNLSLWPAVLLCAPIVITGWLAGGALRLLFTVYWARHNPDVRLDHVKKYTAWPFVGGLPSVLNQLSKVIGEDIGSSGKPSTFHSKIYIYMLNLTAYAIIALSIIFCLFKIDLSIFDRSFNGDLRRAAASLDYSGKTRDELVEIVNSWKDEKGEAFSVTLRQELDEAAKAHKEKNITTDGFVKAELSVIEKLSLEIMNEVGGALMQEEMLNAAEQLMSNPNTRLNPSMLKRRDSGVILAEIFYILGDSIGLKGINPVYVYYTGPDEISLGSSNIANLVVLSDARYLLVDLERNFVIGPFNLKEEFRQEGSYFSVKADDVRNTRGIRGIHLWDAKGLVAMKSICRGNEAYERGKAERSGKDFSEAISYYRQALEHNDKDPWAWVNLGSVYSELKNYPKALECYEKAIGVWPDCAEAYNNIGIIYYNMGRYDLAAENFEKAVRFKPTIEVYENMASACHNAKDFARALKNFENIVDINPYDFDSRFNSAMLNLQIKGRDSEEGNQKALSHLKMARRIRPGDHETLFYLIHVNLNMARIRAESGNLMEASEYLKEAEDILENMPSPVLIDEFKKLREDFPQLKAEAGELPRRSPLLPVLALLGSLFHVAVFLGGKASESDDIDSLINELENTEDELRSAGIAAGIAAAFERIKDKEAAIAHISRAQLIIIKKIESGPKDNTAAIFIDSFMRMTKDCPLPLGLEDRAIRALWDISSNNSIHQDGRIAAIAAMGLLTINRLKLNPEKTERFYSLCANFGASLRKKDDNYLEDPVLRISVVMMLQLLVRSYAGFDDVRKDFAEELSELLSEEEDPEVRKAITETIAGCDKGRISAPLPVSEMPSEDIWAAIGDSANIDYELNMKLADLFKTERAISWESGNKEIEAKVVFSGEDREFQVKLNSPYEMGYAESDYTDSEYYLRSIPVEFSNFDGRTALIIGDISLSGVYLGMDEEEIESCIPWARRAIEEIIEAARQVGVRRFYAYRPDFDKSPLSGTDIGDKLEKINDLTFENKLWRSVLIDPDNSGTLREYWEFITEDTPLGEGPGTPHISQPPDEAIPAVNWIKGVKEVKTYPMGEREIRFFGRLHGSLSAVRQVEYLGKTYWAKWMTGYRSIPWKERIITQHVYEDRFLIPQAAHLVRLDNLEVPGMCHAKYFLEMEDGRKMILFESLPRGKRLIEMVGKVSEKRAVDIILKAGRIFEALHKLGLYYWDTRSDNIWISGKGEVTLFDFDLMFGSRSEFLERALYSCGIDFYMSEERFGWARRRIPVPAEVDFNPAREEAYSLAMILLNLLVGYGENFTSPKEYADERLLKIKDDTGISEGLKTVLNKALSGGRNGYQTMADFVNDLERMRKGSQDTVSLIIHSFAAKKTTPLTAIGIASFLEEGIYRGIPLILMCMSSFFVAFTMPLWGFITMQAGISILFFLTHIYVNRGPPGWIHKYLAPLIVSLICPLIPLMPVISDNTIPFLILAIAIHALINTSVFLINTIFKTHFEYATIGGSRPTFKEFLYQIFNREDNFRFIELKRGENPSDSENDKYDVAVINSADTGMIKDLAGTVMRLLKPGGKVFITINAVDANFGTFRGVPFAQLNRMPEVDSKNSIITALSGSGFVVETTDYLPSGYPSGQYSVSPCLIIGTKPLSAYKSVSELQLEESVNSAALERRLALAKTEPGKPPVWAKGLRIYYDFLRNSARPGRDAKAFGNFNDLKYVLEQARKLGFNAVFLMPLCDTATHNPQYEDSPYSLLSTYAIDPRYIDWKTTGLTGDNLLERWTIFSKNIPGDFKAFVKRSFMAQYANVKTLRVLRDGINGYSVVNFEKFASLSDADIEKTEEYRQVYNLVLLEQYFARGQLADAINYAHKLGLFVGYDQPFFRTMDGVDAKFNRGIFEIMNGRIQPAGYEIGKPWGQIWGDEEKQRGLGRYNWNELKRQDYMPLIGPMIYFTREIGFDFIRGDAFHFGFGQDDLYKKVSELCLENGILFIPETLGCSNERWVNGTCEHLGMMPVDSLAAKEWRFCSNIHDRWCWVARYIAGRANLTSFWMPTHHDGFRIMDEYGGLFGNSIAPDIRAKVLHALFGLALPNYSILFGDEYLTDERVNEPGISHPWKGASPYIRSGADITSYISRINKIRNEHPYLSEQGNLRFIAVGESGLVFVRYSLDGRKALLCIINNTDQLQRGMADLRLGNFGIDTTREFTLKDIFNGRKAEFIPGKNIASDGSIAYELSPGQCQVFELDVMMGKKERLTTRLYDSMRNFIFYDAAGRPGVYAGFPHFRNEWGRDTMISLLGIIGAGWFKEARSILLKWAGLVVNGNIPNVSRWGDGPGNYNTSDAALWFIEAMDQYIKASGDMAVLDYRLSEKRTVRDALRDIIAKYTYEDGEGIYTDKKTGFIHVPKQSTWMDTPNTPREGYPVEIQALWYNALCKMRELDKDSAAKYSALATKVKDCFLKYYWNDKEGALFDILGTDGNRPVDRAIADPAVRSNQIFPVYFRLVEGEAAKKILESTRGRLLIPGALRSLAPGDWPYARYHPYYDMYKSQEERDRAYHNGTGWCWPYPFYWVAAVRERLVSREEALQAMHNDYMRLMEDLFTGGNPIFGGSLPELTDAETFELTDKDGGKYRYAYPKGCGEQAWSVGCAIWGLKTLDKQITLTKSLPTNSIEFMATEAFNKFAHECRKKIELLMIDLEQGNNINDENFVNKMIKELRDILDRYFSNKLLYPVKDLITDDILQHCIFLKYGDKETTPQILKEVEDNILALEKSAARHELLKKARKASVTVAHLETRHLIVIPSDKPLTVVFDAHGTLLKPTWKDVYINTCITLTGIEPTSTWIKNHVVHKEEDEIVAAITRISGRSERAVKEIIRKTKIRLHGERSPEPMPGALKFVKALHDKGVKLKVVSGSLREDALRQLRMAGFLEYISEDDVTGKEESKTSIIKEIKRREPDSAIAYFDDWIEAMDEVSSIAVCFGLPQGEEIELANNRRSLIRAGAHYLIYGEYDIGMLKEVFPVLKSSTASEGTSKESGALGAAVYGKKENLQELVLECLEHYQGRATDAQIREWLKQYTDDNIDKALSALVNDGKIIRNGTYFVLRTASPQGTSPEAPWQAYSDMTIAKFRAMAENLKRKKGKALSSEDEEGIARFTKVLNDLYYAQKWLSNTEEAKKKGHVFCSEASDEVTSILNKNGFKSAAITRFNFIKESDPAGSLFPLTEYTADLAKKTRMMHVYVVTEIAGEFFVIDLSAGQFLMENRDSYKNMGVLIMPIADIDKDAWPYARGDTVSFGWSNQKDLEDLTDGDQSLIQAILQPGITPPQDGGAEKKGPQSTVNGPQAIDHRPSTEGVSPRGTSHIIPNSGINKIILNGVETDAKTAKKKIFGIQDNHIFNALIKGDAIEFGYMVHCFGAEGQKNKHSDICNPAAGEFILQCITGRPLVILVSPVKQKLGRHFYDNAIRLARFLIESGFSASLELSPHIENFCEKCAGITDVKLVPRTLGDLAGQKLSEEGVSPQGTSPEAAVSASVTAKVSWRNGMHQRPIAVLSALFKEILYHPGDAVTLSVEKRKIDGKSFNERYADSSSIRDITVSLCQSLIIEGDNVDIKLEYNTDDKRVRDNINRVINIIKACFEDKTVDLGHEKDSEYRDYFNNLFYLWELDKLFNDGIVENPIPKGTKILLSSDLFNPEDIAALKCVLDRNSIEILDPETVRSAATNRNAAKDKLICIMSRDEFNSLWDENHRTNNKATVLVLEQDLKGAQYLYIEGIIGFAAAIFTKDVERIKNYYGIMFDDVITDRMLKYLEEDNPIGFAINVILKFKPIEPVNAGELEEQKKMVEKFLASA